MIGGYATLMKRYIMLHKPRGVVCSHSGATNRSGKTNRTCFDLLPPSLLSSSSSGQQLQAVGRLDKDTEGLLLFTGAMSALFTEE